MMRRLCLYCLISLPLWVHAETGELAPVPAPPELITQDKLNAQQDNSIDTPTNNTAMPPEPMPEQPDVPMPVHSGEQMEPDITIIRRGQETVQEFRHNGVLYMVKIIPDVGPTYYFIDVDGDGKLDVHKSDLDRGTKVNMWKIWEWK